LKEEAIIAAWSSHSSGSCSSSSKPNPVLLLADPSSLFLRHEKDKKDKGARKRAKALPERDSEENQRQTFMGGPWFAL